MKFPSIVVEWDNALLSGSQRAANGLTILNGQLWNLMGKVQEEPDVVVTFDSSKIDGSRVQEKVREAGGERGWPGRLCVVEVPSGTNYYGHKNLGFERTQNDVVLFLDSDLLPEDGWLEEMMKPLEDFRVSVVVGNTYLDTDRFYSRCVALFWIFEPRSASREIRKTGRLVSNNIAFRRAVFERFPFPDRPTFRGQCSELARILRERGIPLHLNPAAQAAHPPPRGILHFLVRALFAGHDDCSYRRLSGPVHVSDAFSRFRVDLNAVRDRVARRGPKIGASDLTAASATALGAAYYTLKLIAYLLTLTSPAAVRRALTN